MQTFNRTIIIGRLGADPVLNAKGKKDCATFLLSNSAYNNGEEIVQWHKVVAFGKQAIVCYDHLRQGDLCCIEGRLDRKTIDKEHFETIIIAERITFLSHRKEQ